MSLDQTGTLTIGQYPISYLDNERTDSRSPAIVLLPGWCADYRRFDLLIPFLDASYRVVAINWRGHGVEPYSVADFGPREQAQDALAVLDTIGVDLFVPVSQSHGGWALLQLLEDAGIERAPSAVVLDWLMRPPTPEFAASLAGLQDEARWLDAVRGLLQSWLPGPEMAETRREFEARAFTYDFEMWSRSGRVISRAYAEHGTPVQAMAALSAPRPVLHLFSHPTEPGYRDLHAEFARSHPWFSYEFLGGATHFPSQELPDKLAAHIASFVSTSHGHA